MRTFPSALKSTALVSLLLSLFAACGGEAVPGENTRPEQEVIPYLSAVITRVEPGTIDTGEEAIVTCEGRDQLGAPFEPDIPFIFTVRDPGDQEPEGFTVSGDRISSTYAGVVRVRCAYPGTPPISDNSPPTLTVRPGPPTSIEATSLITTVKAGATVSVRCTLYDDLGNMTNGDTELTVSPEDGVSITGGKNLRVTQSGPLEVTCKTPDGELISEPLHVEVLPGDLDLLTTELNPDTARPGEEVTVTCHATDRFQNVIPLDRTITKSVPGVTKIDSEGLLISAVKVDTYPITCLPKDARLNPKSTPADLHIIAGEPETISLQLTPQRQTYGLNEFVRPVVRLFDAHDNEITDTSGIEIHVRPPNTLAQPMDDVRAIPLDRDGLWTFTASLGSVTATVTALVDDSIPTITITSPTRGSNVVNDGSGIMLTGYVNDETGGLESVYINGSAQPIERGQTRYDFSIPLSPRHGLNTVTIEATDVQGHVGQTAQSFLVSSQFHPAQQAMKGGLIAHLSERFIDDGNRAGAPNDLATIIERAFRSFDIEDYIPSPFTSSNGYDIYLEKVSYGDPDIELHSGSEILVLDLTVPRINVDIYGRGPINVRGTIKADKIDIHARLRLSTQNRSFRATATELTVSISELKFDVHWAINWFINLFRNSVRKSMEDAFEEVLRDEVPPAISDMLNTLALDETFAIPGFLDGTLPLNLRLRAYPESSRIHEGGVDLGLETLLTATRRIPWSNPQTLGRGGCFDIDHGRPSWNPHRKLTMAVSLDSLNQILHAVWQGGALEGRLDELDLSGDNSTPVPVEDVEATLSLRMPPVLTDCQDQTLKLQLGEFHIDSQMTFLNQPLSISLILAFETVAHLNVNAAGELSMEIEEISPQDVHMDITSIESPIFSIDDEAGMVDFFRQSLLPYVLSSLNETAFIGFPIPSFDLGAAASQLEGQVLTIRDITLTRDRGHILLQGDP